MKTPEEIKMGLGICRGKCTGNKPHCPYDKYVNGCEDTLNRDALAYIQQLEQRLVEANKTSMHWISVVERLPEDDGYFLCCRNDGSPDVVCMYYGDGDFLTPEPELNNISNVITHWMPLPESPEEE